MIGIILSIIFPGLGQIYFGDTAKGILMMALCFVPYLYPVILIWSVYDAAQLRKKVVVDPISKREATTALIVGFIVIPGMFIILSAATYLSLDFISENYLYQKRTINEMQEIAQDLNEYKEHYQKYPENLQQLIGNNPLKKAYYKDSWQNIYAYRKISANDFILISAGEDYMFETKDDLIVESVL